MNLITALIKWWRGTTLEISKTIQEPVRDGKMAIADSQKQLEKLRKSAIDLLAHTDILRTRRDKIKKEIEQLDAVAKDAAQENKKEVLRLAIERKMADQIQFDLLDKTISENDVLIEQLQNQFNTALIKVQTAQTNLVSLAARNEAAKVRQSLGEATSPLISDKDGLAALNNLTKSVEEAEAQARASENFKPVNPVEIMEEKITEAAIKAEIARYTEKANKKYEKK